jgi:hypothetical protein
LVTLLLSVPAHITFTNLARMREKLSRPLRLMVGQTSNHFVFG